MLSGEKTARLCRRIDYQFNNPAYLRQCLTHRSVGSLNYERLEFLGDSILSFVIANELYRRFPTQSEGQLSRLRAHLVKGETLAEIAVSLQLGDYLYLGQGELKSGGFRRASILADALEALFAAVYLDGGMEHCQRIILQLYQSRLVDDSLNLNLKDPKTQLQEYLQAQKLALPEYDLVKVEGEEHEQMFFVLCRVAKLQIAIEGHGSNRRKAEQAAAKKVLAELQKV